MVFLVVGIVQAGGILATPSGLNTKATSCAQRGKWPLRNAFDERGIEWVYEPETFDLGSCTYTPDFLLPAFGSYWEVKGWLDIRAQTKTALFRALFPDVPLIVATRPVLELFH